MTFVATVSGFLAAQFVAALYSEQFAEWWMYGYERGFYAEVAAPATVTPGQITLGDKELITNYCAAAQWEHVSSLRAELGG
ncbi:hypothetical protein [Thalassobaculum sp.]|uniref:hypothetical protein n=1 Tax=Thalassobaculum sp. TaxID=2022740 RepID=UPI003B5CA7D6